MTSADSQAFPPSSGNEAIETFIQAVIQSAIGGSPIERILAFAQQIGPGLIGSTTPGAMDMPPQAFRLMALSILDQVPRPELRYASRKVPRPGRNDRCDCGSGRKYKQCCAPFEHNLPFENINLLPYVLACMPRKRWAELAQSAIDPAMVFDAARTMLDDEYIREAIALLAPWFQSATDFTAAKEQLFDTLLDAYDRNGQPRKKQQLLEQAIAQGDRTLRSAARQRLATMAADKGNFTQAWDYFRQAQRDDANSPSLSHLEVVLLLSEGKPELASERARFWIARLNRIDPHEYPELIAFLRDVAENGADALLNVTARRDPAVGLLRDALEQAPAVASHYRLMRDGHAEDFSELAPDPKLAAALREWEATFPRTYPHLTITYVEDHEAWDFPDPWLDLLRRRPLLWQSLDVLDDAVLALDFIADPGTRPLRERLLERAQALLELNLRANDAPNGPLPWICHTNRPALRLIAQRIVSDAARPPSAATLARMEWLLELNRNDNHGFRDALIDAYLYRGDDEKALALAAHYPDDASASILFGRALALFALDRRDEADAALDEAHGHLPKVAPMLLAAKPRKPKIQDGWVSHGGPDQAWLYREGSLALWQRQAGALEWLRARTRRKSGPTKG